MSVLKTCRCKKCKNMIAMFREPNCTRVACSKYPETTTAYITIYGGYTPMYVPSECSFFEKK